MPPLVLTVVLFATPPERTHILPPGLTVVLFATPPEETSILTPEVRRSKSVICAFFISKEEPQ